jgi:hypothetical protein
MTNKPTELAIFRNGTLMQRGPLIAWQVEGETLVLHARGLAYYTRYMFVTTELDFNQDQAFIVRDLIDHHQDKSYGDFGLDTTGITSHSVTRQVKYNAGELINIGEEIRDLAEIDDGFDMVVNPSTRDVVLTNPSVGTVKAASVLDARVIAEPNMASVVTAGQFGSAGLASGVDASGNRIQSISENTTVRNNWGLAYAGRAVPGADSQTFLDATAIRLRDISSAELFTPSQKYFSATGISVDDIDIGDTIEFEYDAGFGSLQKSVRIQNLFVSVSGGDLEHLTLDFV